jgi:hypothetical protein
MQLENMKDDELLTEAMKQGYNPEFNGENKKTPKEFLEVAYNHNKMLKERNDALSTQVDQLNDKLNRVVQYQSEMKQKAVDAAIRSLKSERTEAIKDGDHEKVEQLDQEISKQEVAKPKNNIILDQWLSRNPWYEADEDLAVEADIIAQQLQGTGRFQANEADYEKLLKQVESRVKKQFPDKFKNPKKDNPPEVETGRNSSQRESTKTFAELPADAKRACEQFVKDGVMTKEQYLEIYEWD